MSTSSQTSQASLTSLTELSTVRSTDPPPLERGPSDCAVVRLLDFRLELGSTPGCCPGLDARDARCDRRDGRVTFIGVSEQETRRIPVMIGELAELQIFWAHSNHAALTGPLPQSLSRLSKLTQVNLEYNQLTGQLPDVFHDKPLELLMLANNNLTGRIPLLPPMAMNLPCVLLRGPSDSNNFTCADGDPRKHIGSCYHNLRANGIPPCTLLTSVLTTPIVFSGPIDGDQVNTAPESVLVVVLLSVSATLLTVVAIISVIMCYQRRERIGDWELESAGGSWVAHEEDDQNGVGSERQRPRLDGGNEDQLLRRSSEGGAQYPVTLGVQPPMPLSPIVDTFQGGQFRGQREQARIDLAIPLVTKKDMMNQ